MNKRPLYGLAIRPIREPIYDSVYITIPLVGVWVGWSWRVQCWIADRLMAFPLPRAYSIIGLTRDLLYAFR